MPNLSGYAFNKSIVMNDSNESAEQESIISNLLIAIKEMQPNTYNVVPCYKEFSIGYELDNQDDNQDDNILNDIVSSIKDMIDTSKSNDANEVVSTVPLATTPNEVVSTSPLATTPNEVVISELFKNKQVEKFEGQAVSTSSHIDTEKKDKYLEFDLVWIFVIIINLFITIFVALIFIYYKIPLNLI